jgi:ribosomal protein L11 methylase PrmA
MDNKMNNSLYNEQFYDSNSEMMESSAREILKIFFDLPLKNKQIIDVGCGEGIWLAEAEKLGAEKLTGIDGRWVNINKLRSKNIEYVEIDLTQTIHRSFKMNDL